MDLRAYYRKIRKIEATIEEEFPVITSLPTQEGGKGGRFTEVARGLAAKMVTDGVAQLATAEEGRQFRARVEEARKKEEQRRRASQVQLTVLAESDLRALQRSARGSRKE